jgi:hypothetical protein
VKDLHPAASHPIPGFITAPGETDILLASATVSVVSSVMLVGVLFFWLHSLPERTAHKHHKLQIELIAVLSLLSLLTHVHLFWVIALILAFIKIPEVRLPDVSGTFDRIAGSLEQLAISGAKAAEASALAARSQTVVQPGKPGAAPQKKT